MNRIANPEIRPGLSRMARLLSLLEHPERDFKAIHVVGTNGKGSVSAMLESIFLESGYRTCMYTSPHLVDICERVRFSGLPVEAEEMLLPLRKIRILLEDTPFVDRPTYFEVFTAAAFSAIGRYKPDVAIIEAGMGGRLDATNIARNVLLTVVTSIGVDHSEFLGQTIEGIALEKFLVLRPGGKSVFSGGNHILEKLYGDICNKIQNSGVIASGPPGVQEISVGLNGNSFKMAPDGTNWRRFETGLGGKFQIENAATAIIAASELSEIFRNISEGSIHEGLRKAMWPGRMEELSFDGVRIILDGAHNPDGVMALAESFRLCGENERTAVVFAAMKDKDLDGMIRIVCSSFPMVVFTTVPGCERSALPSELKMIAEKLNISSSLAVAKDPFDAIRLAEKEYGLVLCCGSLFLGGAIKSRMLEKGRFDQNV